MSADILIREDTLGGAVEGLAVVTAELEGAERFASDLANAVGHPGLSNAVQGFAEKWEHKRGKMLEETQALHSMLEAVAETFDSADRELMAAITEADHATAGMPAQKLGR